MKHLVFPAIHINCKQHDYCNDIMHLAKTMETRSIPVFHGLIGRDVGIIRTGKGQAQLVGFAHIKAEIAYYEQKAFDADYPLHKIGNDDPYHISKSKTGKKYGYVLEDVARLDEPIELPSWTFNGNRSMRDIADFMKQLLSEEEGA